ncbi:hypothetical protein [Gordonia iterans]
MWRAALLFTRHKPQRHPGEGWDVGSERTSDEKAFAHLQRRDGVGGHAGKDVGIKVGDGETIAEFRIPGTDQVASVLEFVAARRR